MADIRKRNGMLIVIGVLILALLVYLILDFLFGHIMIDYKTCPKFTKNSVYECLGCFGVIGCKKPYRQVCTHEVCVDTHRKIRIYWDTITDDQIAAKNISSYPMAIYGNGTKDMKREYYIKNPHVFKCISLHGDFLSYKGTGETADIRIKGCIYKEYANRHMWTLIGPCVGKRDLNNKKENFTGRYFCHNNLCNYEWNMYALRKPRSRRFFEGPYAPEKNPPKNVWHVPE